MDHDRGRDYRKKKYNPREREEKPMKRPIILLKSKESSTNKQEENVPQAILLKTRDGERRAVSPQTSSTSKSGKETDPSPTYHLAPRVTLSDLSSLLPSAPEMKSCVKLLSSETLMVSDSFLNYLTDSTDFLVIGCLGFLGSGKSTIMSNLANPHSRHKVFPLATQPETAAPGTEGIDVFITSDRLIFLDSEPLMSTTHLHRRSEDDGDNEEEILSLQYAALLLSVCHILIVVQDCGIDPELTRCLLTAEMLKPSVAPQPEEDPSLDYFPYIVFIHNKVDVNFFTRENIRDLQETYKYMFAASQLPISNGIGLAGGSILRSLTPEFCGDQLNVFGLPHYYVTRERKGFNWNIQYCDILRKTRLQLLSLPPIPLTHTVLTEKNWWHYTQKIWEDIKKSTLFPEYARLLPTEASMKNVEIGST